MNGRDEKCVPNIIQETSNGKGALEDLGTDGKLMLKALWFSGMDSIDVAL
jgi:hypothetical protein